MDEKSDQVFAWRRECLIKAGWEPSAAMEIAKSSVDLRIAEAAIRCGSQKKALYILGLSDE
jgi:hypothetical protein